MNTSPINPNDLDPESRPSSLSPSRERHDLPWASRNGGFLIAVAMITALVLLIALNGG